MHFLPGAFDSLEGPILVGMAPGGMTAAEIEQAIETTVDDSNDIPDVEFANRMIWPLEALVVQSDTTNGASAGSVTTVRGEFNPRWTMPNPDGWTWWAYNFGTANLTTGGTVSITAKYFGVWVR